MAKKSDFSVTPFEMMVLVAIIMAIHSWLGAVSQRKAVDNAVSRERLRCSKMLDEKPEKICPLKPLP